MTSLESLVPRYAFLTKGAGKGDHTLAAFDAALREAGVAAQNLVPVSSVFPPECRLISRDEGQAMLRVGQVTFCVMARIESNVSETTVAAAIGLALPEDGVSEYGYIAEHHEVGQSERGARESAEGLAVKLLAAKLGGSAEQVRVATRTSIAQTASVAPGGLWVSAVALCVFVV